MSADEVNELIELRNDFATITQDVANNKEVYDKWHNDEQFVESEHTNLDVQSSAPAAGDLKQGEVRLGDGTGPNGRDEIFWSVDGATVARVEADSIIT